MDFLTILVYLLLAMSTVVLVVQAINISLMKRAANYKLPPGPTPVPILGNLLKLGAKPHHSLTELAKAHGPIMTLKLGHITTVVISSGAVAREALQKQDLAFSSRSVPNALHAHDQYRYSVVWLPVANRWRSLRKALNSNIFAGSRLDANQHLRRRKVEELIAYVRKTSQGQLINYKSILIGSKLTHLKHY